MTICKWLQKRIIYPSVKIIKQKLILGSISQQFRTGKSLSSFENKYILLCRLFETTINLNLHRNECGLNCVASQIGINI